MKRLYWKSRTFVRVLNLGTIALVLVSCSSTRSMPVMQSSDTLRFTQRSASRDTIYLRDSVLFHDSVIYRERMIHDTVYITKEVYRDAHNSKSLIQNSVVHDTIIDVRVEKEIIEHPPERFVPKFYKRCTIAFWAIVVLLCLYIVLRIMRR